MIQVEKTATTLDEGIKNLMGAKKIILDGLHLVVKNYQVILKNKLTIGIIKQK